jgi:hypothetical protein
MRRETQRTLTTTRLLIEALDQKSLRMAMSRASMLELFGSSGEKPVSLYGEHFK